MTIKKPLKPTKKYINEVYKKLEVLFKQEGTLEFRNFCELAWILDIEYDDRLGLAIEKLEHDRKILTSWFNGWWLDVIPF